MPETKFFFFSQLLHGQWSYHYPPYPDSEGWYLSGNLGSSPLTPHPYPISNYSLSPVVFSPERQPDPSIHYSLRHHPCLDLRGSVLYLHLYQLKSTIHSSELSKTKFTPNSRAFRGSYFLLRNFWQGIYVLYSLHLPISCLSSPLHPPFRSESPLCPLTASSLVTLTPASGTGSASRPSPAPHFMKSWFRCTFPSQEPTPMSSHTTCLKEREGTPWSNKCGKPRVIQSLTVSPFLQNFVEPLLG